MLRAFALIGLIAVAGCGGDSSGGAGGGGGSDGTGGSKGTGGAPGTGGSPTTGTTGGGEDCQARAEKIAERLQNECGLEPSGQGGGEPIACTDETKCQLTCLEEAECGAFTGEDPEAGGQMIECLTACAPPDPGVGGAGGGGVGGATSAGVGGAGGA